MLRSLSMFCTAVLLTGCNVFFATDSVDVQDGQANTNTSNTTSDACGADCTCESSCVRTCDSDCAMKCEGGACDFSTTDGATVTCESGADCYVDCERGSCDVTCESGASCVLRCGPHAGSCEFSECEGDVDECAGKESACNADCP